MLLLFDDYAELKRSCPGIRKGYSVLLYTISILISLLFSRPLSIRKHVDEAHVAVAILQT